MSQQSHSCPIDLYFCLCPIIYIYIYLFIYLSEENYRKNLFCLWNMYVLGKYYTKWNQSDRDRQILLWYHLYVESKKYNKTSEYIKKETDVDKENKLVITSVKREGEKGKTMIED